MNSFRIFNNSRVIVTGHTGFKGSWLTAWLKLLNAKVMGISLNPPTKPSNFYASGVNFGIKDVRLDIRNRKKLEKTILQFRPNFIFHLAAQSLVGTSYNNPSLTWETNVLGTLNVLDSLRKLKHSCTAVIITSDKCYFNKEVHYGYKESDTLGGKDPYSGSKASAELLVKSYISSYFSNKKNKVRIVTARAGNVVGGGDWATDRIIPDCVRSWSKNKIALIRNPKSTRPWQHVMEIVGGYLKLASELNKKNHLHGESFNFGPTQKKEHSVLRLVRSIGLFWDDFSWKILPKSKKRYAESILLRLNCGKAKKVLKWNNVLKFEETIKFVAEWYNSYYKRKSNMKKVTEHQIREYQKILKTRLKQ